MNILNRRTSMHIKPVINNMGDSDEYLFCFLYKISFSSKYT